MKNILLITTATIALIAGANLASAQRMDDHRDTSTAAVPEQKAPDGKTNERNVNKSQKSDVAKPAPHAQVLDTQVPDAQRPGKATNSNPATVGQTIVPKTSQPHSAQSTGKDLAPNTAGREGSKALASTQLSPEQHATIRDTLRGEKVEHLQSGGFSISIGEAVPRTVHLHRLPHQLWVSVPEYRHYEYIMVGDEILIVDPHTLRIVAVIPA